MTKTLTEQWREGTLQQGWYYMLDCNGKEWFRYLFGEKPDADFVKFFKEVLGPVPNYMDCKGLIYDSINLADARKRIDELVSKTDKLEKKLEIATKALEEYANCKPTEWMTCVTADKALREMEGVK